MEGKHDYISFLLPAERGNILIWNVYRKYSYWIGKNVLLRSFRIDVSMMLFYGTKHVSFSICVSVYHLSSMLYSSVSWWKIWLIEKLHGVEYIFSSSVLDIFDSVCCMMNVYCIPHQRSMYQFSVETSEFSYVTVSHKFVFSRFFFCFSQIPRLMKTY